MATSDVELQGYAKTYIIPFVVFVVVIKLSRRQQSKLYAKAYAYIVNRIGYRYNKLIKTRKEKLFLGLHEQAKHSERRISILEIGAGGGANFKYYPKNSNVTCLDPNPEFAKYLEQNIAQCPWLNLVESVWGSAEDMSAFPSGSVDAVVCTLVLCSVNNQDGVLKEICRILRPGGRFYFVEHVCADDATWLRTLQWVVNPFWRVVTDGCELTKKTWTVIETANFSDVKFERFKLNATTLVKPHIIGTATK